MPRVANRPGLVLLLGAALTAGCGASDTSPSSSVAVSAPVVPTSSIGLSDPSVTPSWVAAPTAAATSDNRFLGKHVVTVSDNLRVRSLPRVADDSIKYEPLLPLGTELQVIGGPVSASGYTWYQVIPLGVALRDDKRSGWVAMAGTDGEAWIALPGEDAAGGEGFIEGLVTGIDGAPLTGVSVEACAGPECMKLATAPDVVDGRNYRLGPLMPGAYRVSFFDPRRVHAVAYYVPGGYSPSYRDAAPVLVSDASIARVDMQMPLANRIFGTVTGLDGVPLADVDVLAWSPDGCVAPAGCLRDETAVDGSFAIRGVGRATYTLRLSYMLGYAGGITRYYTVFGTSTNRDEASLITVADTDVRIDPQLMVDADPCNRPLEPFRGWVMRVSPYACANGSSRRVLFGGQELKSVAAGGPGYVALGWREFEPGKVPTAASFTSVDGATWSAQAVDSKIGGQMAVGHGWVVALGPRTGGRSKDGTSWQLATATPVAAASIADVTGDGPGFVAIGLRKAGSSHAGIWTSQDGLLWRQVADQAAFAHFCPQAIAWRPGGFVAVGSDCHSPNVASAVVITSRDGRTWRRAPSQSSFRANASLTTVIASDHGFIASGRFRSPTGNAGAAVWTSRDGVAWRRVVFFRSSQARWLVRTSAGFEIVSLGSRLFRSSDGTVWSAEPHVTLPADARAWAAFDAATNGETVVMAGSYEIAAGAVVESGGVVWTQAVGP